MYFTTHTKENWVGGQNSLVVQWLGFRTLTVERPGSVPGWGTKIPQVAWLGQKKKEKTLGKKGITESHFPIEEKF